MRSELHAEGDDAAQPHEQYMPWETDLMLQSIGFAMLASEREAKRIRRVVTGLLSHKSCVGELA